MGIICPARLDLPLGAAPVPPPLARAMASGLCAREKCALLPLWASGATCLRTMGGKCPGPKTPIGILDTKVVKACKKLKRKPKHSQQNGRG